LIALLAMNSFINAAVKKRKHNYATVKNMIEDDLKIYTYKIGIFRLTPLIDLNFGYDSNSLSSYSDEVSDFFIEAVPSISEKFAIKQIVLIKAHQQIKYLFYKRLENLRQWLNSYNIGIMTGRKSIIFTAEAGRNSDILRPTSEFDIPANQFITRADFSLKFPFILRGEFNISYSINDYSYEGYYSYYEYNVEKALSRKQFIYAAGFEKAVSSKTHFFVDYNRASYEFSYDPSLRNYRGYGMSAGFIFGPSVFFKGYIKFGYSRLLPENSAFLSFKGLIVSGEIEYMPTKTIKIKFSIVRQPQFSVFSYYNNFYIQEQAGGDFIWAFTEKIAVGISYLRGKNSYPFFSNFSGIKISDDYYQASLRMIYKIKKNLFLESGGSFYHRDSNQLFFLKDRALIFANFKMEI